MALLDWLTRTGYTHPLPDSDEVRGKTAMQRANSKRSVGISPHCHMTKGASAEWHSADVVSTEIPLKLLNLHQSVNTICFIQFDLLFFHPY